MWIMWKYCHQRTLVSALLYWGIARAREPLSRLLWNCILGSANYIFTFEVGAGSALQRITAAVNMPQTKMGETGRKGSVFGLLRSQNFFQNMHSTRTNVLPISASLHLRRLASLGRFEACRFPACLAAQGALCALTLCCAPAQTHVSGLVLSARGLRQLFARIVLSAHSADCADGSHHLARQP